MSNPTDLSEILSTVQDTITTESKGGLVDTKEDKLEHHRVANLAQMAIDKSSNNEYRIDSLKSRTTALLGDGTVANGRLADITSALRQTQATVTEVQSDTRNIVAKREKRETVTDESKGLFDSIKLIASLVGIIGTVITNRWFVCFYDHLDVHVRHSLTDNST